MGASLLHLYRKAFHPDRKRSPTRRYTSVLPCNMTAGCFPHNVLHISLKQESQGFIKHLSWNYFAHLTRKRRLYGASDITPA